MKYEISKIKLDFNFKQTKLIQEIDKMKKNTRKINQESTTQTQILQNKLKIKYSQIKKLKKSIEEINKQKAQVFNQFGPLLTSGINRLKN